MIFKIFFLFLFLTQVVFLQAQTKTEKIEVIGVKSSTSSEAEKSDKTGFHTTTKLDQAKERYDTLPQILEREAGLRVRQFGGLGSYSTLSIRGTNPNQSRYYVDGIPFNNSQTGEVNLADLPFDNLEEVEVYRSGTPLGFAGSSIGGAVNLKTIKPTRERTRINIAGGSFHTGRILATHTGLTKEKKLGYTLFGVGEKSDQNFPFANDKGTIFNTLDDEITHRKNAQYERAQNTTNLFWNFFQTDFRFLLDLNHRRHGVTGPANNQTEKPQRKYSKLTAALNTDTKIFFWENLQLESKFYFSGFFDEFFDPRSELSSGRPNSKGTSETKGMQFTPTLYLLDFYQIWKFSFGVEWEDFRRDRRNANHQVLEKEPIRKRRFRNLQIQDEIRLFHSRLILVPLVKFDEYFDTWENDFSLTWNERYVQKRTKFTNPRLGILWKVFENKNHKFQLQGNGSKDARIPSFLELFGERGQVIGNSKLKPEIGKNLDFGFQYKWKENHFEYSSLVSFFKKDIQDMILFIPNSQFTLRAENVDSAQISGLEFSNSFEYKNWKLTANYTYQKALNTSINPTLKGKYLPLRPMHEFYGSIVYKIQAWTLGLELTYIGAVFRDRTNEYINYLPARNIYGFFLTYVFWKKEKILSTQTQDTITEELKFHFEIKNLADKQFSDFVGYPLPGRMWFMGLSYVF